MKSLSVALAFLGLSVALIVSTSSSPARAQTGKVISIGMANTFFADLPDAIVGLIKEPFSDLMKDATGLKGELHTDRDPFAVADQLDKGTLQLGVFHGHELAWIRKKHPGIKPLVIAVNKYGDVSGYIVVNKDCSAKDLAGLRGHKFDLPIGTKQQCRVFVERCCCVDNNQPDWTKFFGTAARSSSIIEALNDVARKQTDAVVVDRIALELYKQERGPVFEKNLRVLVQSPQFPPVVIAYKEGALSPAVLKRVNDGLRNAGSLENGKEIMKMWQVEAFQSVPAGFEQMLTETCKRYPLR